MSVIIVLVILYPFWALVHEYSHILTAHLITGVKSHRVSILPTYKDGHWRFAHAQWTAASEPSQTGRALIYFAPRIPDLVGALAFSLTALVPWPWPWALFWSGALIDLGVGSWGKSSDSDLRRFCELTGVDPWRMRVGGFAVIVVCLVSVWSWI